jgi:GDP-L-fucose synthase
MAFPVQFLLDNVRIQANVLEAAHAADVNRLVFIASSCIYPRNASQPMRPEQLFTGPLEPTNESYAIAKLAGVTLVNSYRRQYGKSWVTCLPTNLYGPGDNFNPESSHVLAGLIHRFHVATQNSDPSVLIWGSGKPRRELLHVDDFATACAKILTDYDSSVPINVGTGEDVAISDLAELVAEVVGYSGEIVCDNRRPDGMPRKLLDVASLQSLGWSPQISLKDGVRSTYEWYRDHLT